jgi:lysophospholipase L1-like esterase
VTYNLITLKEILFCFIFIYAMNTTKAQDWAQLNRFKQANAQLCPSENDENRVVFMGNSITEGWLQDSLSLFKNKSYINRGIGGQTSPQMKYRFMQDVIELKPKAVVILAGINDIAQNTGYISIPDIAANIKEMTCLAKSNNIKVVICSVLPSNYFPWRPQIHPADKVIALNILLKEIAHENEVFYLDYYTEMVDNKKGLKDIYTTDGVHCSIEGYRMMELLIEECLKTLF